MDRATAPLDLLREFRTHFVLRAAEYRNRSIAAPIREQPAAAEQAKTYEKFVEQIDASLRDWA